MISFNPIRQLPQLNKTFRIFIKSNLWESRWLFRAFAMIAFLFFREQSFCSCPSVRKMLIASRALVRRSEERKARSNKRKSQIWHTFALLFVSRVLQFTFFEARCDGNINVDQHELIRGLIFLPINPSLWNRRACETIKGFFFRLYK